LSIFFERIGKERFLLRPMCGSDLAQQALAAPDSADHLAKAAVPGAEFCDCARIGALIRTRESINVAL
jgi:hypothetical protein